MEMPDQQKQVVYSDTAKAVREYSQNVPQAAPGALEDLENGLNRLAVEIEQIEARIQFVLGSPPPTPPSESQDHLSGIDAQTARLHALVGQLVAIRDRVRL